MERGFMSTGKQASNLPRCEDDWVKIVFKTGGPVCGEMVVFKSTPALPMLRKIWKLMKPFMNRHRTAYIFLFDGKDTVNIPKTFAGVNEVVIRPSIYSD
jgi:hypothetical protein